MISLNALAADLENKLNLAIESGDFYINDFMPNERYLFHIANEAGQYRKATRDGNTVTKYINGVLSLMGDEKAGVTPDTVNASLEAVFEFVIPDIDRLYTITEEDGSVIGTITFKDAVRELVDATLSAAEQDYMQDDDENYFLVTTSYSFANTGALDIRPQTGESLTMTVFIDYSIVASGVSAANLEMWMPDASGVLVRIYPTRLDITRHSVQEGVIPSDVDTSKTLTQTTQLTIAINKPLRFDTFDEAALKYTAYGGSVKKMNVKIIYPMGLNSDGTVKKEDVPYSLSFADVSIAGELNLAIPVSATLHEEAEV